MTRKELASLAARLKALREAAAWTQQDLASRAYISISMVSQIERGIKTDPRVSTILALADALAVDVGDLLGRPPARGEKRKKV
jgi:transcriptional regulator with XRE-family HTH domain